MRLIGKCDFCGREGKWEGGLFRNREEALSRKPSWAACIPWSVASLPEGCNHSTESLEEWDVTTRFACPKCWRADEDGRITAPRFGLLVANEALLGAVEHAKLELELLEKEMPGFLIDPEAYIWEMDHLLGQAVTLIGKVRKMVRKSETGPKPGTWNMDEEYPEDDETTGK